MAKRILIVDDASFMRLILKNIIAENGYEVAGEAANGVEGVEKFRLLRPDLVLMDITMPEMDGIEALKAIRAEFPHACVVMCSAMGQQSLVIEAIKAGAMDFVVKPFQEERILEAIRKAIG